MVNIALSTVAPIRAGIVPEWLSPISIINNFLELSGPWLAFAVVLGIIFVESGLLVGFFLPGDSVLFATGMLIAAGALKIPFLVALPLLFIAAFLGDQLGYYIGRKTGPTLFNRPDSRLFKQENVDKAHRFFEKHGGQAVILARFVPIIRTFVPVIVGIAQLDYKKFVRFNAVGGLLWAVGVTVLGYFLGTISFIEKNIDAIFVLIVLISFIPVLWELFQARRRGQKKDPRLQ